jgi:hypothetical protein
MEITRFSTSTGVKTVLDEFLAELSGDRNEHSTRRRVTNDADAEDEGGTARRGRLLYGYGPT